MCPPKPNHCPKPESITAEQQRVYYSLQNYSFQLD
nr:MAG TPA_asm: hypothetical protein [Caudoviricetes sp.]